MSRRTREACHFFSHGMAFSTHVEVPTGPNRWNRVISFLERESEGALTYTYLSGFLAAWRWACRGHTNVAHYNVPESYLNGLNDAFDAHEALT